GNLPEPRELAGMLPGGEGYGGSPPREIAVGGPAVINATSDTDVLTELIVTGAAGSAGLADAAASILPRVKGAYSLVFMDENTLYAARDPQGFRPLVLDTLGDRVPGNPGWVVASET